MVNLIKFDNRSLAPEHVLRGKAFGTVRQLPVYTAVQTSVHLDIRKKIFPFIYINFILLQLPRGGFHVPFNREELTHILSTKLNSFVRRTYALNRVTFHWKGVKRVRISRHSSAHVWSTRSLQNVYSTQWQVSMRLNFIQMCIFI